MRIPVQKARAKLADAIDEVRIRQGRVLITRYGKLVAALVGPDDLERLEALDKEEDEIDIAAARRFERRGSRGAIVLTDEVKDDLIAGRTPRALLRNARASRSEGDREAPRGRKKKAPGKATLARR